MPDFLPSNLLQASPTLAMYQAIQSQQSDMDTADAKRKELAALIADMQQKTAQSAQMNPLMLQHQDLQNQGLQAGLAGIAGTSQSLAAKGQVDQATIPSQIDEKNAESSSKVTKAASERWQRLQSTLMQATPLVKQVDGTSPGAGMAALTTVMQQNGYSQDSPEMKMVGQLYGSVPSGQLGTAMDHTADALLKLNPEYKKGIDEANIKVAGGIQEAKIHAGGTVEAARIAADSRTNVQALKNEQKSLINNLVGAKNYQGAATAAQVMAMQEDDPVEKQKLLAISEKMAQADVIARQAGSTGPNKLDIPTMTGQPAMPQRPVFGAGEAALPSSPNPLNNSTANAPPAAVQMLKQNPNKPITINGVTKTAQQWFDEKYGK